MNFEFLHEHLILSIANLKRHLHNLNLMEQVLFIFVYSFYI